MHCFRIAIALAAVRRLREELQAFYRSALSTLTQGVSIARDPVKLWNLGLEVNLRLNSNLRILPITLSRTDDKDEIRGTIKVPTSTTYGPYLVNLAIALRIAHYIWMTSDEHFRWLAGGQFTMDATLFFIGLITSSIPYGVHLALLRQKHDFAFVGNSVLKMNRKFAGLHYFITCSSTRSRKMAEIKVLDGFQLRTWAHVT